MEKQRVLVAGATGYLGQFVVSELQKRNYQVRVLIRKESQKELFEGIKDFFIGEITKPETLTGICKDVDWVFTSVGITRQKEGLTYMDVDYQGNKNLLAEAVKSEVRSFLYVSAIGGDKLRKLKIFEAKERFVDALKLSGLPYTVMRPNGFFSDMKDFLNMAQKGTVHLFGNGQFKLNPIHGNDLAVSCVNHLSLPQNLEVSIGGPDVLSQNQIAEIALKAWGRKVKIVHYPDCIRRLILWSLRTFTSPKTYGPYEFFLTLMAFDNIAPQYGSYRLESFFKQQVKSEALKALER